MIRYTWKGEPFYSDRDILSEVSEKHDEMYVDRAIRLEGYNNILKFGDPDLAEIEIFFSTQHETEFSAIAMLTLGDNVHGYVFPKHHDAVAFLKEFAPMVESVVRTKKLTEEKDD